MVHLHSLFISGHYSRPGIISSYDSLFHPLFEVGFCEGEQLDGVFRLLK
jgi:hypothetical protein